MALGTPVAGTRSISAAGGTSCTPSYPTGIGAGDVLVLFVYQKPATANGGTVTTPSGWTLRGSALAKGGYGSTLGADTGNTNLYVYTKDTVSGSESGTLTVTLGDNNVSWAKIMLVPTDGGTVSYGFTSGEDTSAGNVSVACSSDPGFITGDMAMFGLCIPTDVTTPTQFTAEAITATGATFGAATEVEEQDTTTGNDLGGFLAYATVSAGPSSAAPTFTATAGGTTTNVRGPGVVLRIREASGTVHTVTAATLTYAGQSVASVAATVHAAAPATKNYAGQAIGSSNATIHAVTAATLAYAGQTIASVAATVHTAAAAVANYAGQAVSSFNATIHAVIAALLNYEGKEVTTQGGAGDSAAPQNSQLRSGEIVGL